MEKVMGGVEVGFASDDCHVLLAYREVKPNASGVRKVVLSPRSARYLANLLVDYATVAEANSTDTSAASVGI